MTEFKASKLDPATHILIDQPLLRLPSELSRNNLKSAQFNIETTQKKVNATLSAGIKAAASASSTQNNDSDPSQPALSTLNTALSQLQALKKKLTTLNTSSSDLASQSLSRINHLEELNDIPSLADVKYDEWSRVRLDRLLVDYLLRMGYTKSARGLAEEKGIEGLVDLEEFELVGKIERSLRVEHKVDAALAWCGRMGGGMRKMNNNTLEYELRLQQYIELVRAGFTTPSMKKLQDARAHAAKHLSSHPDPKWKSQAAVLLVISPDMCESIDLKFYDKNIQAPTRDQVLDEWEYALSDGYKMSPARLYSEFRWQNLAKLFLETHHSMYNIPQRPLLHMALTAGLSALKTPACHSKFVSPSSGLNSSTSPRSQSQSQQHHPRHHHSRGHTPQNTPTQTHDTSMDDIINTPEAGLGTAIGGAGVGNVCPICSTELNQLARRVPFAHHTKSIVESDPVVLPNGRIYGRERLERLNEKLGTEKGYVRDPVEIDKIYAWEDVAKVYIS